MNYTCYCMYILGTRTYAIVKSVCSSLVIALYSRAYGKKCGNFSREPLRFLVRGSAKGHALFYYRGMVMTEEQKRLRRVCFTGHRPEKLDINEKEVKNRLKKAIQEAVNNGYTTFISGMARGVDMWAAELVLEERKSNGDIKLICASPYEGFEKSWSFAEKHRYNSIMKKADYIKYVCEHYSRQCSQIRNVWMVDHSALVIAAYNGESGGTRNTIRYASSKKIKIYNILEQQDD